MKTEKTEIDEADVLLRWSWIILLVLIPVAAIVSLRFAGSVAVGGLLALGNHYWLRSILRRAIHLPVYTARRYSFVRFIVRLSVLAAIIYLFIVYVGIDILGLLLGLSVLVISTYGLTIYLSINRGG